MPNIASSFNLTSDYNASLIYSFQNLLRKDNKLEISFDMQDSQLKYRGYSSKYVYNVSFESDNGTTY